MIPARRVLAATLVFSLGAAGALVAGTAWSGGDAPPPARWSRLASPGGVPANESGPAPALGAVVSSGELASPPVTSATPSPTPPAVSLPLSGCPPPPGPGPIGLGPDAWKPPVLVAEDALPEPIAPDVARGPVAPAPDGLSAIEGKGMWIWKFRQSESGDAQAIVDRARAAGLTHLWVRVGDSRDGFYAGDVLDDLVPRARVAGIAVLGWGFPYLHDPVADAAWAAEAMAWTGPGGEVLDGFSPDLERSTEGVVMTERRARVYLGLVRQAAGPRLVVGTVYRPTDRLWASDYPYTAIASYVDALAPMVYWGCTEPGEAATQALERLRGLAPVHLIGQAYDMATEGGRVGSPTAEETGRFLGVARDGQALGASFWVWQSMPADQWGALSDFSWP